MAVGDTTERGEVYKAVLTRTQEQVVEFEIMEDGENVHEVAWEVADSSGWDTVYRELSVIERVTCAGEV